MRDAEKWADEWDFDSGRNALITLIRAIQSDASRSAARSERERAARVCDEQVAASRAMGEPSGLAELCRNRIRELPDVPA